MSLDTLLKTADTALHAALDAAAPEKVMAASLRRLEDQPSAIFALGKAAGPMAAACRKAGLDAPGVLISHDQGLMSQSDMIPDFNVVIGGHPVPNENSMTGARMMLSHAEALGADDHLLMLVSGGGSALMCLPGQGLSLSDKIMINERLLASGLDIHAMNAVRRFFSGIKGGRLARAASPAKITQWVLSDVPPTGDELTDLSAIASGPMAADPVAYGQMLSYLKTAGLDGLPQIQTYLEMMQNTPDQQPLRPWQDEGQEVLSRVTTSILASNEICCAAAASSLGGNSRDLPALDGEAAVMGQKLAEIAMGSATPIKAATGGETVVTFAPDQDFGKGGRSQELALSFLMTMMASDQASPKDWVLLAAGTDGRDGPTDAAGAIVHSAMVADIGQGMSALTRHDAYPFLDDLGALIKMPPTGTNLADIAILLTS